MRYVCVRLQVAILEMSQTFRSSIPDAALALEQIEVSQVCHSFSLVGPQACQS